MSTPSESPPDTLSKGLNKDKENSKLNKSFIHSKTAWEESWTIFSQFVWITTQMLFEIVPGIFQMQMLGHLDNGAYYLAGVGLGRTFANVIGRSQAWGMTTGLFTLLPQCIGANKYDLIPTYIQRSFYVTTFICMIMRYAVIKSIN